MPWQVQSQLDENRSWSLRVTYKAPGHRFRGSPGRTGNTSSRTRPTDDRSTSDSRTWGRVHKQKNLSMSPAFKLQLLGGVSMLFTTKRKDKKVTRKNQCKNRPPQTHPAPRRSRRRFLGQGILRQRGKHGPLPRSVVGHGKHAADAPARFWTESVCAPQRMAIG